MRLILILNAFSTIAISSAIPWNTTPSLSTLADESRPYELPNTTRRIPVAMIECMGHNLSEQDYLGAKEAMLTWAENSADHIVPPGNYEAFWYPNVTQGEGVTWYICNCKLVARDKIPRWEIDEVQETLEEKCGKWQSGWVWSKKWEKGYNVVPTSWFRTKYLHYDRVCPKRCF
ncbi:hypothetical protein GQX73_g5772 [Xylaria multiplex]|uniref:SCP domain-containing protein n=1 Tax=Xylaria multiplex TaxID=323545 RepID=A0A7C8MRM9_9PEZI|nr:hypothetical protein GQX73_g5772 [Xylaria multiplex]